MKKKLKGEAKKKSKNKSKCRFNENMMRIHDTVAESMRV